MVRKARRNPMAHLKPRPRNSSVNRRIMLQGLRLFDRWSLEAKDGTKVKFDDWIMVVYR